MKYPRNSQSNNTRRTGTKKPFSQGNLDGYCGIYCAVNAIHYLFGPISRSRGNELLHAGLKYLENHRSAADRVTDGTVGREIVKLLKEYYGGEFAIEIRKPFHRNKNVRLRHLLSDMQTFLQGQDGVIVLGLEGRHSHWTLVTRVTSKSLILFDSSRLRYLPICNCSTSENNSLRIHHISPTHLIYVTSKHRRGRYE